MRNRWSHRAACAARRRFILLTSQQDVQAIIEQQKHIARTPFARSVDRLERGTDDEMRDAMPRCLAGTGDFMLAAKNRLMKPV